MSELVYLFIYLSDYLSISDLSIYLSLAGSQNGVLGSGDAIYLSIYLSRSIYLYLSV